MLKQKLLEDLVKVVEDLGYSADDLVLSISKNPAFGDYTTNSALQLANLEMENGKQNHLEIAKQILKKLGKKDYLEKAEVAGPGFVNFYLKDTALIKNLPLVCSYTAMVNPQIKIGGETKKILVEFAHPNTHKAFHIGHTRNIILGEAICRLLEAAGNEVFRANYQGDIGLHVAKALWGINQLNGEQTSKKATIQKKAEFLGKAYTLGSQKYETEEKVRVEINEINTKLYARDKSLQGLWQETRRWSLDYFDSIYQLLGVKFDRLFFESEVETPGKELVEKNADKIFKEDQGAIIFKGDEYGLHNRVFITSAGHPTYEAKEIGLAKLEYAQFRYDQAIHVVAEEQAGYFEVVFKAIELIFPKLKGKKYHLSYGLVDLKMGKMSSRTGQVVTFDYLLEKVKEKVAQIMAKADFEEKETVTNMVTIGAIKFAMLQYSPKTRILFDINQTVSLQGDSGPYVQYSYARAKSVLRNAHYDYEAKKMGQPVKEDKTTLEKEERMILRRIEQFPELVKEAANSLSPQVITNFLLDLAKEFNLFYQKHPIIKATEGNAQFRLALTCAVAVVLKQGLFLLGIEAPERM